MLLFVSGVETQLQMKSRRDSIANEILETLTMRSQQPFRFGHPTQAAEGCRFNYFSSVQNGSNPTEYKMDPSTPNQDIP